MASTWYDTVPCSCGADGCRQALTVTDHPSAQAVVVTIANARGAQQTIRLTPAWARVVSAMLVQSAGLAESKGRVESPRPAAANAQAATAAAA